MVAMPFPALKMGLTGLFYRLMEAVLSCLLMFGLVGLCAWRAWLIWRQMLSPTVLGIGSGGQVQWTVLCPRLEGARTRYTIVAQVGDGILRVTLVHNNQQYMSLCMNGWLS